MTPPKSYSLYKSFIVVCLQEAVAPDFPDVLR